MKIIYSACLLATVFAASAPQSETVAPKWDEFGIASEQGVFLEGFFNGMSDSEIPSLEYMSSFRDSSYGRPEPIFSAMNYVDSNFTSDESRSLLSIKYKPYKMSTRGFRMNGWNVYTPVDISGNNHIILEIESSYEIPENNPRSVIQSVLQDLNNCTLTALKATDQSGNESSLTLRFKFIKNQA